MAQVIKGVVERGATYSKQVVLQFIGRKGKPAFIDTTTKPLESSVNTPTLLTVDQVTPLDLTPEGLASQFSARFIFADADGVASGKFRADRDITPQGESDLEIEYEFTLGLGLAAGATLTLGDPDADEAPAPAPEPAPEPSTIV